MKVLTFSKQFPKKHINAGEPTNFKEKILSGEKIHTIRPETNKWKIGDQISMRYWTGKPYHSKQEIFCEEFEVVELINFSMYTFLKKIDYLSSCKIKTGHKDIFQVDFLNKLAKNDGLTFDQFENWFCKSIQTERFDLTLIAWQPTNY